jgi:hypothetical protein
MFLHVVNVKYLDQYKLLLTFNNDTAKVVDLQNELDGAVFEPLQEIDLFQQVYVSEETQTIEWPNGADFAPEFLYEIGREPTTEKAFA